MRYLETVFIFKSVTESRMPFQICQRHHEVGKRLTARMVAVFQVLSFSRQVHAEHLKVQFELHRISNEGI